MENCITEKKRRRGEGSEGLLLLGHTCGRIPPSSTEWLVLSWNETDAHSLHACSFCIRGALTLRTQQAGTGIVCVHSSRGGSFHCETVAPKRLASRCIAPSAFYRQLVGRARARSTNTRAPSSRGPHARRGKRRRTCNAREDNAVSVPLSRNPLPFLLLIYEISSRTATQSLGVLTTERRVHHRV